MEIIYLSIISLRYHHIIKYFTKDEIYYLSNVYINNNNDFDAVYATIAKNRSNYVSVMDIRGAILDRLLSNR